MGYESGKKTVEDCDRMGCGTDSTVKCGMCSEREAPPDLAGALERGTTPPEGLRGIQAFQIALEILERDWPPMPKKGPNQAWLDWAFEVDQMTRTGLAALRLAIRAATQRAPVEQVREAAPTGASGRELGKRIELFISRDMGINPGSGITQRTMFDTIKEAIERWEATPSPSGGELALREARIEELKAVAHKLSMHPYCAPAGIYIRERIAELLAAAPPSGDAQKGRENG